MYEAKGNKEIKQATVKWNEDTIYALGLYKRVTTLVGIWPTNNRILTGIQIGVYITFHLSSVFIFFQKFLEYGNCGTTMEIVDTLSVCMASVQICIKSFIAWFKNHEFRHVVDSAVMDWSCVEEEQSHSVMLVYARKGRVLLMCQMAVGFSTAFPLMLDRFPKIVEVIDEVKNESIFVRNIPLLPRCWISLTMSEYSYLAYWTLVVIFIWTLSIATVCCNVFVYGFGLYVYTQFEILSTSVNIINGNENISEQRRLIKMFAKRHNHLLNIANDLENGSTFIILSEVTVIIFVGCIAGVMLLIGLRDHDSQTIIAMVIRLTLVMMQLFIYNFMGECLSNQTEKLQTAIYNCPWYELSSRTAKDMKLIMIRSNNPFRLTAGKLSDMNLISFKSVVKSMFSFFSVLRLMLQN
uniref:Odorant receptor n=2 Tax=Aphidius gifuensis TaxID=684658 RepID=A0A3Q9ELS3_APHGI|nr:odorant receptor [Aphidius gifuensis]